MIPTWIIHYIPCDQSSYHTHGLDAYGSLELELNLPMTPRRAGLFINLVANEIAVEPSALFQNIDTFEGGRYHSLAITKLPEHLKTTSICEEEIMSIEHTTYPVYGVQFHPESILSPQGTQIIANLMKGIQS